MDLPAGTRNFTYAEDMAIFRTRTQWIMLVLLLVVLFTLPLWIGNRWLSVSNLILVTIIAATGLNILTGYCGQLSIGHAGFIAVGAYTSAVLTARLNLPFPVGLISAGLLSGIVGLIFGIPSVRVKGFYLAISTIAAQVIIIWVLNHWTGVTGGFNGIVAPIATIGPIEFKSQASQFFLILIITILVIFGAKNRSESKFRIRDSNIFNRVMTRMRKWFQEII